MSNYCCTDITINATTKEQMKGLRAINDILESADKFTTDRYKRRWLGSLAEAFGIGKEKDRFVYDEEGTYIQCRGTLGSYELTEEDDFSQLSIQIDDEGGSHLNIWKRIRDKFAAGAELIYCANCEGDENLYTNDPTIAGLFMIDIWDNTSKTEAGKKLDNDSYYELTEDKAIKMLNDYFGTSYKTIKPLQRLADESECLELKAYEFDDTDEELNALNDLAAQQLNIINPGQGRNY